MIRKGTAIFFILLANFIMLAHAVVPHHHHKSQVCIESNHCLSDSYAHNHNTSAHDHEHDGGAGTENCALKQAVVISTNSVRQEFKCLDCDDNHPQLIHFQAILFSNKFISFIPKIGSNAQIPFITSSYLHSLQSSLGLRAPPIV